MLERMMWCVVTDCNQGHKSLNVYGPYEDQELADAAANELITRGVDPEGILITPIFPFGIEN